MDDQLIQYIAAQMRRISGTPEPVQQRSASPRPRPGQPASALGGSGA